MAHTLRNICTKKYWNRTIIVKIIVNGWMVYFLRHSVLKYKIKQDKSNYNQGFIASYDIWPVNGADLFSFLKGKDKGELKKKGKYKLEKKEVSCKKQKEANDKVNTQSTLCLKKNDTTQPPTIILTVVVRFQLFLV